MNAAAARHVKNWTRLQEVQAAYIHKCQQDGTYHSARGETQRDTDYAELRRIEAEIHNPPKEQ